MFGQRSQKVLDGIIFRIEALESTPAPPPPSIPTESIVAELEVRLDSRFVGLTASFLEL